MPNAFRRYQANAKGTWNGLRAGRLHCTEEVTTPKQRMKELQLLLIFYWQRLTSMGVLNQTQIEMAPGITISLMPHLLPFMEKVLQLLGPHYGVGKALKVADVDTGQEARPPSSSLRSQPCGYFQVKIRYHIGVALRSPTQPLMFLSQE